MGQCHRLLKELFAQHVRQAPLQRSRSRAMRQGDAPLLHQLALVPDGKTHVGPRQGVAAHGLDAVGQLSRVGLEELAPRRSAEEQLFHFHRSAHRPRHRAQFAAARIEQKGTLLAGRSREQRKLGDRRNGRQRLAPKAHGGDTLEVVQRANLAGGMAAQRHRQFGLGNAAAVVFYADQPHAPRQQAQRDLRGAGVERVVHQLAHYGGGALDDFAGRNLADEFVGQVADGAAGGFRRLGSWGRNVLHAKILGIGAAGRRARHNGPP